MIMVVVVVVDAGSRKNERKKDELWNEFARSALHDYATIVPLLRNNLLDPRFRNPMQHDKLRLEFVSLLSPLSLLSFPSPFRLTVSRPITRNCAGERMLLRRYDSMERRNSKERSSRSSRSIFAVCESMMQESEIETGCLSKVTRKI